jgi:hypothetical protein
MLRESLDAVVEGRDSHGATRDRVVAVDERVDENLAHGIGRDERRSTR